MSIQKVDFTIPAAKQTAINQIFILKRAIRRYDNQIKQNGIDCRIYERAYRRLQGKLFNEARIAKVNHVIVLAKAQHKSLSETRRKYFELLADWMVQFDRFKSKRHEKAQLLGISHQHLNRFMKDLDTNEDSLFSLAFIGAEDHFEKDVYACTREARETPLKFAATFRMMKAFKENPRLMDEAFNVMQDMFAHSP